MQTKKARILPRILSGFDDQPTTGHAAQVVATAKVVFHLALQGLEFRGHDEHPDPFDKGNFLETLRFLFRSCTDMPYTVPNNATYTSPDIQRDMTWAATDIVPGWYFDASSLSPTTLTCNLSKRFQIQTEYIFEECAEHRRLE